MHSNKALEEIYVGLIYKILILDGSLIAASGLIRSKVMQKQLLFIMVSTIFVTLT